MFTQQAWGDIKTCTNTTCSHNRLGVIQRLIPTLYVYTTGLGWYTYLYQHYMFTPQAWGDTRTCTNTICSHNRLGMIHRLVPTLYVHTTGLGWYNDLYQHYMFTIQAWGDTTTCTNTICSHNRLGVIQRLLPNTICMYWVCIQWMAWKYISNYYCHWPQTATKLNLFENCIWFDVHVCKKSSKITKG
jgi:hypothetical protein